MRQHRRRLRRRRMPTMHAESRRGKTADYGMQWRMYAAYIRRKRQELASRHSDAELKDLESVLLAPYVRMHAASLSLIELVFIFAMELKMEIDDAKRLVKFGRTYGYYVFSDAKRYVLADPLILKREHADHGRLFAVSDSVMMLVDAESGVWKDRKSHDERGESYRRMHGKNGTGRRSIY